MRVSPNWILLAIAVAAPVATPAQDAPFLKSPRSVVRAMLDLAEVGAQDVVYDLGSGDGRVVLAAAGPDYGARAVGVESQPNLVEQSRHAAEEAGLEERAQFIEADLFETDFSEASVVVLYLHPKANRRIEPLLLEQLARGTRVVAHRYPMIGWTPDARIKVEGRLVFLYVMPPRRDSEFPTDSLHRFGSAGR